MLITLDQLKTSLQAVKTYINNVIPKKVSDLTNDSGFGTYTKPNGGIPKTDLADAVQTSLGKADTALQSAPVTSVNNKTGAVNLSASDVGALPDNTVIPTVPSNVSAFTNDAGYLTQHQDISGKANTADLAVVATSGSYADLTNKPTIPSKVSDLTNDSGYIATETDPTVPSWAKESNKPTYTAQEVGALPSNTEIHNIPSGGTSGQYLKKSSNSDYAVEWGTVQESPEIYIGSTTPAGYTIYINPDGFTAVGEGVSF